MEGVVCQSLGCAMVAIWRTSSSALIHATRFSASRKLSGDLAGDCTHTAHGPPIRYISLSYEITV